MRVLASIGLIALVGCSADIKNEEINVDPTFTSVFIAPDSNVTSSTDLLCIATAEDENEERLSLTYLWTKTDGSVLGEQSRLQLSPEFIGPTEEVTCTVTARDQEVTITGSASVSLENSVPTIGHVSISPETALVTSLLECTYEAYDPDLEDLTVLFSWKQNGTEVGTESSLQLDSSSYSDDDIIVCQVTVEDGFGGRDTRSAEIVIGNTEPVIGSVSLSPDPVTSIDSLTCTASDITDLEQDDVALIYTWNVDGEAQTETSDTLSGPFAVGSQIDCTVTPNDGKVDGESVSASSTIVNSVPVVDSLTLDAGPIYTDGTITAVSILSDIDAEHTATASYFWHVIDAADGIDYEVQTGSSSTLGGTLFDKDDQVYVIAIPNDGLEDGASVTSSSVTISNSDPTGLTVGVTSSASFYNDSTLTCSASASDIDPEDSALTYTYLWSTGETGASVILDGSILPGGEITCTATATDTSGAFVSADSTETLLNRAPTVDSVSLPQDVTATTSSVLCDVMTTDLDGETPVQTYTWSVEGAPVSETSDTYTGPFVYGEEIECTATASDASETGTSMSASTTVLNSLPVVSSVIIDPSIAYTDSTCNASIALSDADAAQVDALTASYQWYVDNAPVGSDTTSLSNGEQNEFFAKGQDVYVVVTPNDGVQAGSPVQSNTITVQNSLPVLSNIAVSPDPAVLNTDELVCGVAATDADGDTILYTYEWSDSSDIQKTVTEVLDDSNTLLVDELTADTWTCTVTPFDGEEDGVASSDSAIVENKCSSLLFELTSSITAPAPVFDFTEEFTIEGWIRPSDQLSSYAEQILLGVDGSALNEYRLSITDGGHLKVDWYTQNGCDSGSDTTTEVIFAAETWTHFAFVAPNLVYKNGELVDTLGEDKRGSCFGAGPMYIGNFAGYDGFNGHMSDIRLWQAARSQSEIQSAMLELEDPSSQTNLRGNWLTEYDSFLDTSGNGYDATDDATLWTYQCPQEDLDGDGIATWEDCNDDDATLPNSDDQDCDGILLSDGDCDDLNSEVGFGVTGVSTTCAARSCEETSTMGYSTGDGAYWLDPDGDGQDHFEAYCDMTTDGGGWTLAAKIESGSSSQWAYNSTAWDTTQTEFNQSDFTLTSGEAKYETFDTVALSEIRLEDPTNGNEVQLEAVGDSLLSFLSNQAENTSANVFSTSYANSATITYIGYNPLSICDGNKTAFINGSLYRYNVYGTYNANGGNVATGHVRIGFWGSGSDSYRWHHTSTCGFGLGVKVYGYNGTSQSGTTFGSFTLLWVR